MEDKKKNPVGWFEIPVKDMDRAVSFYEKVFKCSLERMDLPNIKMSIFPHSDGQGAGGSLVKNEEFYTPSGDGILIYFTTPTGNLDDDLKVVEEAGGKIIIQRKKISDEHGFMCVVADTEGNRISIHSMT